MLTNNIVFLCKYVTLNLNISYLLVHLNINHDINNSFILNCFEESSKNYSKY